MNSSRRVAVWRAAFCPALLCVGVARAASLEEVERRLDEDIAAGRPLVAHVVVVLADNANQGIVPVPAAGAYARYQRIPERAAARLFVTPVSVQP